MKRTRKMKNLMVLLLAIVCCLCNAQISDEQAIFEARRYVAAFAPEALDEEPRIFREPIDSWGPSAQRVIIYFGEVVTSLKNDGTFLSFSSMSKSALLPKGGAPDKYETDEDAWRAFEDVLARVDLDLPEGLKRHRLERVSHEGQDYVYRFYMRLRPYGYETLGGWKIRGEIQRITGRAVSIVLSRPGWTYEPPNVRVSESQAIEKAIEAMGGAASDWRVELKYGTSNYDRAPEYFRSLISQQVMRLLYRLQRYDAESGKSSIISIDSVTGAVLSRQTLTIDSPPVEGTIARTAVVEDSRAGTKPRAKPADPKVKQGPPAPSRPTIMLLMGGSLLLVGGSMFLLRRGWAARRNT